MQHRTNAHEQPAQIQPAQIQSAQIQSAQIEPCPKRVHVVEVGPRDGFQMEQAFIPTELKVRSIQALAASGIENIEAVSFVHPRVVPQMRDADEVMRQISRRSGTRYTALVPNVRGAERALAAGVDGLHLVICVTESYNQRNVGLSCQESLNALRQIVELAKSVGDAVPVTATMAATFGCPFEGQKSDADLVAFARQVADTGADEIGLADSAGLGHPVLVRRVISAVRDALPTMALRMHLHDTRGLGITNAVSALELGIDTFDVSLGGLGGCPLIKGASGNIATEDFVNLCDELSIEHGVDLDRVRAVSREIEAFLGKPMASRVLASGTRSELYQRNRDALD